MDQGRTMSTQPPEDAPAMTIGLSRVGDSILTEIRQTGTQVTLMLPISDALELSGALLRICACGIDTLDGVADL